METALSTNMDNSALIDVGKSQTNFAKKMPKMVKYTVSPRYFEFLHTNKFYSYDVFFLFSFILTSIIVNNYNYNSLLRHKKKIIKYTVNININL